MKNQNFVLSVILTGLITLGLTTNTGSTLTFQDVGKQNLKSTTLKANFKIPIAAGGSLEKFIQRQKNILLNLTAQIKNKISFGILNKNEQSATITPSIITPTIWYDLHILSGTEKNPEVYLGEIIDKTHTELGKAFLLGTIARPVNDSTILENRQKIVKKMIPLLDDINSSLESLTEGEAQLLSFWNDGLQLPGTIRKQYFKFHKELDQYLNTSPVALDIKSTWELTQSCLKIAVQGVSAVLLSAYALSHVFNEYLGIETPGHTQLKSYSERFTGTAGPIYAVLSMFPWLECGTPAAVAILNAVGLPSALEWLKADLSVQDLLQKKLVYVARYFKNMQEIYHVIKDHPEISSKLTHFQSFDELMNQSDPDVNNLLTILSSGTFAKEYSYFYRKGKVLSAFELLKENESVRNKITAALSAIAEIDMYASVANLYHTFKSKRVKYCFPDYIEKQHPFIELENYWNPFIDPENVVANTTTLGSTKQTRNAIITGPNSAGKSTIMKSIALAIILAQSIGIAPAEDMKLTPFSHVATYMEISEEVAEKASLFQSEVTRAIELQKTIQSMDSNEFSFTIFDELFSGTSPQEGMAMAYATAEAIGALPNSITMIATHYELLTELERNTDYFTNYNVSFKLKSHGSKRKKKMIRTYKLNKNPSTQHFALAIAEERGAAGNIIDRAKELMAELVQTGGPAE